MSDCGFTSASAVPTPAAEPRGQAALPWLSSLATEQVLRPLVESLSVFGNEISILEAEVLLSRLLSIWRLTFSDFGFFLVPAFVGLIVAFTSIEGGVLGDGHRGEGQRRERRQRGDQGLAQGELLLRSGR